MSSRFHDRQWMKLAPLFGPWAVSSLTMASPVMSWWVAWLGSVGIFIWVWSGEAGGVNRAQPWRLRILHPLFLMHAIFAGYGFMTSIFLWFDLNGVGPPGVAVQTSPDIVELAARAQRYLVLAHGALACGLVLGIRGRKKHAMRFQWKGSLAGLLLFLSAITAVVGIILKFVPGMEQLEIVFSRLSLVSAASSLGPCFRASGRGWLPVSLILNGILLLFAVVSGWKEEVLVFLVLLGLATFPLIPKLTVAVGTVSMCVALLVLPVIANAIRENNWAGKVTPIEGLRIGIENLQSMDLQEFTESSWSFATDRLSEAGLFMDYIKSVEQRGTPREGLSILKQAILAPVPRILWKGKPNLEKQVMERPYTHGVASELSTISAKPHPVVDGYLLGGSVGIVLSCMFIGWLGSTAFAFCENWFGGVFLGGVFFNGLFSVLWRGNCFEFMSGTLFWAVAVAVGLNSLFRNVGWTAPGPIRKAGRKPSHASHDPKRRKPIIAMPSREEG